MPGKDNIIQEKTKPVDQLSNRPNRVEHKKKYDSLAGETGGCVSGGEERAIGCAPKKAEIGIHSVRDPCLAFIEKAHPGFLYRYSIRNSLFWIDQDSVVFLLTIMEGTQ